MRKCANFDINKIADEVYKAASDWMRSIFGEAEADYLYVEALDSNTIEVRDELWYDENHMLIRDALNPVIQSYDPESFFDFYAATVLRATLWDEEARKETWYVKHDVNAVDGEYDLVWIDDLDANPYVVKEFDGAWHVGILGFDDKMYFGDPVPAPDLTFGSWDDAMKSIPSSDVYEFVRVGSHNGNNIKRRALMRKRAWTAPYDLDGFDMGKFVEEFDPVGTKVEPWDDYDGYSVLLEDRAHPGFEAWFDVAFDEYGNWECDWNQYIFSTNDSDNRFRKMFQYYYDESVYSPQFEKAEEAALDRIAETYGLPNPRGAMKKKAANGQYKKSASFADVYIGDGKSLDGTDCEFWAKIDVDGSWGWEAISEYDDAVVDDCYGFETAEEAAHDCRMTHSIEANRKNAHSFMLEGKKRKCAADGQIDLYRATYDDFLRLKDGSAWTWEGMSTDSENLSAIVNWFDEQGCSLVKNEFWCILGSDMNSWCGLTGDNAYPDDLNILCIDLDNITNLDSLFVKKFEVGARWLDDVVDNNEMREQEKRRIGSANRSKRGQMNWGFALDYSLSFDDLRSIMFGCMEGQFSNIIAPEDIPDDDVWECAGWLDSEVDEKIGDMIQEFVEAEWDRWEGEEE